MTIRGAYRTPSSSNYPGVTETPGLVSTPAPDESHGNQAGPRDTITFGHEETQAGFGPLPDLLTAWALYEPVENHCQAPEALADAATGQPGFDGYRCRLQTAQLSPVPFLSVAPGATVAVLDRFGPTAAAPSHGELVETVLQQSSTLPDSEIARVQLTDFPDALALLTAPGEASAQERLSAYVEHTATAEIDLTDRALKAALDQPGSTLTTVNNSGGDTPINLFFRLYDDSVTADESGELTLSDAGRVAFEALGLPPETSPENLRQFAERGIGFVDQEISNNPEVQAALGRHQSLVQELKASGVAYVVSAGNDGGALETMTSNGLRIPESADDNFIAAPETIFVGALDTQGTADPSDDGLADFSSLSSGVDALADGVGVPINAEGVAGLYDGTSFASPLVAGRLALMASQHPEWSVDDRLQRLFSSGAPLATAVGELPVVR